MNRIKTIVIGALPFVLFSLKGVAQNSGSDLMHAMKYSQSAVNTDSNEKAAAYAAKAFYDTEEYDNIQWNNYKAKRKSTANSTQATNRTGTTITHGNSESNRAKTDMSKVGLKTNSSGYNRGAELAKYYAKRRNERAKQESERRERLVNEYMTKHRENSNNDAEAWLVYIENNSNAKLFSQEDIDRITSNGLHGNLIIEDNGQYNMLPENLLEGTGDTSEPFEEKIKNMSDEEIDKLAEELNNKLDNGEDLTDEEIDFLYARELERKARLEEERRQLEEQKKQLEEQLNNMMENIDNSINIDF